MEGITEGHREVNGLLLSIYSWVTFLQSGFISCKTNYQITRHTHIQMQVKKYGKPCINCFKFYTFLFSSISINDKKLTILLHFISFNILSLICLTYFLSAKTLYTCTFIPQNDSFLNTRKACWISLAWSQPTFIASSPTKTSRHSSLLCPAQQAL